MTLHLEGCVKLLVTVFALSEVRKVKILLLLTVNVTLHVHHDAQVVVEHLVAIPALEQSKYHFKLVYHFAAENVFFMLIRWEVFFTQRTVVAI